MTPDWPWNFLGLSTRSLERGEFFEMTMLTSDLAKHFQQEIHPRKLTWMPQLMVLKKVTPLKTMAASWYLCSIFGRIYIFKKIPASMAFFLASQFFVKEGALRRWMYYVQKVSWYLRLENQHQTETSNLPKKNMGNQEGWSLKKLSAGIFGSITRSIDADLPMMFWQVRVIFHGLLFRVNVHHLLIFWHLLLPCTSQLVCSF